VKYVLDVVIWAIVINLMAWLLGIELTWQVFVFVVGMDMVGRLVEKVLGT
jgi:hypothetical protein